MSTLNLNDILDNLKFNTSEYSLELIDSAIEKKEELVPELIYLLKELKNDPEPILDDANFIGHLCAVTLLTFFKNTECHSLLVDIFSLPDDIPYFLFGDLVVEDLPTILYATCDGNFDRIKELIVNEQAMTSCRWSAMTALNFALAEGKVTREEVLAIYEKLLLGENKDKDIKAIVLVNLSDICATEKLDLAKEIFAKDPSASSFLGLDDFTDALEVGVEDSYTVLKDQLEKYEINEKNIHTLTSHFWYTPGEEEEENDGAMKKVHNKEKKKKKNKLAKSSRKKNRKK